MISAAQSSPLGSREMLAGDVLFCVQLIKEKTPHEGYDLVRMQSVWPSLLHSGRVKAAVVEDLQGRVIAFGASAFLTQHSAVLIARNGVPLVARRIIESVQTASPLICTVNEIAACNAGSGIVVFILHSGLSDVVAGLEEENVVKAQLLTTFLQLHQGYNISGFMVEAYGPEERLIYEATSLRVLDDYSTYRNWHDLPVPPQSPRPTLLGITRKEVMQMRTHVLLPLFVYRRPQCGFTEAEQRLLQEALKGRTDEELASCLNLSRSAIKKQWIRTFEKAERLPEVRWTVDSRPPCDGRGPQRRHLLLRAIRTRPEELSPFLPLKAEA